MYPRGCDVAQVLRWHQLALSVMRKVEAFAKTRPSNSPFYSLLFPSQTLPPMRGLWSHCPRHPPHHKSHTATRESTAACTAAASAVSGMANALAMAFIFAKGLGLQGCRGNWGVSRRVRCSCCSIWIGGGRGRSERDRNVSRGGGEGPGEGGG